MSAVGVPPELHKECYSIQCCQAKGIEHCGFCEELPCEKLRTFVPDESPGCPPVYHIENLKERRANDIEAWLQGHRDKWHEEL